MAQFIPATEKQIALINKLATKESYAMVRENGCRYPMRYGLDIVLPHLANVDLTLLSKDAASWIIGLSLDYIHHFQEYGEVPCKYFDAVELTFSKLLEKGEQITIPLEKSIWEISGYEKPKSCLYNESDFYSPRHDRFE